MYISYMKTAAHLKDIYVYKCVTNYAHRKCESQTDVCVLNFC